MCLMVLTFVWAVLISSNSSELSGCWEKGCFIWFLCTIQLVCLQDDRVLRAGWAVLLSMSVSICFRTLTGLQGACCLNCINIEH